VESDSWHGSFRCHLFDNKEQLNCFAFSAIVLDLLNFELLALSLYYLKRHFLLLDDIFIRINDGIPSFLHNQILADYQTRIHMTPPFIEFIYSLWYCKYPIFQLQQLYPSHLFLLINENRFLCFIIRVLVTFVFF